jgi:hypothetical protein
MSDDDGLSEPQLLALLDTVECEFYYFKMSLNIIFLELSIIFTLRKIIIPSSHFHIHQRWTSQVRCHIII